MKEPIQLQAGVGGWVRAFVPDVAAALYLRYEDRKGRLSLVDLFIEGTPDREERLLAVEARANGKRPPAVHDREPNTDLLRAIRLGELDALVNSPSVAADVREGLKQPGPDLRTAAAAFRMTVYADDPDASMPRHWVHDMLLCQVRGSGVRKPPPRRTPEPVPGARGRRYTLDAARDLCRLEVPSKPFGDEFYASLATAYLAISEWSSKPNVEIAEAVGTTPGRVAKWVADARKRGALAPGVKGRRG